MSPVLDSEPPNVWEAMRLMFVAALIAPALAACSAEPRWTLWEIREGEAIKKESGLERLVCETLRDRAERNERARLELHDQLRRDLARARSDANRLDYLRREAYGLNTPERVILPSRFRCRPDGETY